MTLKIVFRPRAWGVKNVPRRGPVILASNHLSFSDHFFGPLPVPRKVIFLAKSEYFTGRGLKGLISKVFFAGVGQIPIDRAGGAAGEQAHADRPAGAGGRARARHLPGRAPAARTAACTGARPAWPGSPSSPAPRSSRAP